MPGNNVIPELINPEDQWNLIIRWRSCWVTVLEVLPPVGRMMQNNSEERFFWNGQTFIQHPVIFSQRERENFVFMSVAAYLTWHVSIESYFGGFFFFKKTLCRKKIIGLKTHFENNYHNYYFFKWGGRDFFTANGKLGGGGRREGIHSFIIFIW